MIKKLLIKLMLVLFLVQLSSGCSKPEQEKLFPLCGVLTKRGYRVHEAKQQLGEQVSDTILLLPVLKNKPLVKRYQIVDKHSLPGFLEAHVNWWVCVEKGKIIKEASVENGAENYGTLSVEAFSVDFTNGERGVE